MKSFFIALYLTLIEEKEIIKIVSIVAAAIGGGIVKVIFENKTKKLSFWGKIASFFVAVVVCYGAYPAIVYLLPEWAQLGGVVVFALMSNDIVRYIISTQFLNFLINKLWSIKSK